MNQRDIRIGIIGGSGLYEMGPAKGLATLKSYFLRTHGRCLIKNANAIHELHFQWVGGTCVARTVNAIKITAVRDFNLKLLHEKRGFMLLHQKLSANARSGALLRST